MRVLAPHSLCSSPAGPFLIVASSTADALATVLTKVNRMDIVTLLEGPIFDYGNVSGTRCFADDGSVFRDQADGKVLFLSCHDC